MSERIAKNLRGDFYESIINKDIAFYDERRTGDLSKSIFSSWSISLAHSDSAEAKTTQIVTSTVNLTYEENRSLSLSTSGYYSTSEALMFNSGLCVF